MALASNVCYIAFHRLPFVFCEVFRERERVKERERKNYLNSEMMWNCVVKNSFWHIILMRMCVHEWNVRDNYQMRIRKFMFDQKCIRLRRSYLKNKIYRVAATENLKLNLTINRWKHSIDRLTHCHFMNELFSISFQNIIWKYKLTIWCEMQEENKNENNASNWK